MLGLWPPYWTVFLYQHTYKKQRAKSRIYEAILWVQNTQPKTFSFFQPGSCVYQSCPNRKQMAHAEEVLKRVYGDCFYHV